LFIMSESPGPGGDADSVSATKGARRPAEDDAGADAVPSKTQKFDKDEEGNDDDVALDDEEYDEDEADGGKFDGRPRQEKVLFIFCV